MWLSVTDLGEGKYQFKFNGANNLEYVKQENVLGSSQGWHNSGTFYTDSNGVKIMNLQYQLQTATIEHRVYNPRTTEYSNTVTIEVNTDYLECPPGWHREGNNCVIDEAPNGNGGTIPPIPPVPCLIRALNIPASGQVWIRKHIRSRLPGFAVKSYYGFSKFVLKIF